MTIISSKTILSDGMTVLYFSTVRYWGPLVERCLFSQQKMKVRSHTSEFKLLAFSAVTANMYGT